MLRSGATWLDMRISTLLFPPMPQNERDPPPFVGVKSLKLPSWYLGTALVPMSMPTAENIDAVEYL